jgi:hypothetical protein
MIREVISTVSGFILLGALTSGCATTPAVTAEPSASPDTGYGLRAATVDYLTAGVAAPMGLPAGARPGECYVRAVVPAQYETVTERVVKKAASSRIEVTPAEFQDVEERVLVRPATTRLEPVPATYRTETERVLVRPAYTVWKRSSELTAAERAEQKIDPSAGDILCLVEVPAEYTTVTREVLATPATTREIEVPAEYRTVTVRKMVTPERQTKIEIPAEYDTVSRQVLKAAATTEWREVLCGNNATPAMMVNLQQSLRRAGFDPGRDDGRVDPKTMSAVRAFQQARGLPMDGDRYINMATVKALGVTP